MDNRVTEDDVVASGRRAELAQQILDNPIYKDAFKELKIRTFEAFSECPTSDINTLQHIRLTMTVVTKLESFFKSVMLDADATKEAFEALINDKVI